MYSHLFIRERRARNGGQSDPNSVGDAVFSAITELEFEAAIPPAKRLYVTVDPDRSVLTDEERGAIIRKVYAARIKSLFDVDTVKPATLSDQVYLRSRIAKMVYHMAHNFDVKRSKDQTGR